MVGGRCHLPWVSLGDEPFSPEGWDGDQAVKAGVNAPQAPLEQGGEGSGIAPGSAMAGFFSARVVLLRHERVWCGGLRKWVAQHGHRSRLWARATVSLRRMVATEFGTCRSGRIGGAAGSITGGKAKRFELRGGRS